MCGTGQPPWVAEVGAIKGLILGHEANDLTMFIISARTHVKSIVA